ncbi:unnamed protein product [Cuscuta epithymum]|uniref:Uncharacterized protein n=1 Tax=Cuscuta epithymum TaxID=186058 RepID=A0AAV0FY64_9ASTE|nr:unnamed protein product [Cuscuta epithymum]
MEVAVQANRPHAPMSFDDISMERSKSFVKALQELKNLRPQLYSAADYCEKSYLQSEQKQMVLENLKDYAVRALVNAVDHLGTVSYKLTDLVGQQSSDLSATELKIFCLKQRLLSCQTYSDREGLRQQQLLAVIPRHHKHYTLPNIVNKKVHFGPHNNLQHLQSRNRLYASGNPTAKTLSWHLASETTSTLKEDSCGFAGSNAVKSSGKTGGTFNLLDPELSSRTKAATAQPKPSSMGPPPSSIATQTLSIVQRDTLEGSKPTTPYRSVDNQRRVTVYAPARSKSLLSAFFVKYKLQKLQK